ncbi:MAG TPA: PilT/PilU family type 4a pilus ATPase [Acidimicrobiia bacterium]|nr:PilT/PilU family type 4a pilus ATPase [Acidimicrobiia bacterium]
MDISIEELLQRTVSAGASDLHLKVGSPPAIRVASELRRLHGLPVLSPNDTEGYAQLIFTQKAVREFKERGEADFAWGRADLGRFRVTAFRQRGSVSMVLRRVPSEVASFEDLGLPGVLRRLAGDHKGLLLITGPSGSGKSSTMAAVVDHINSTRPVSIVTIEDPIEVVHPDKLALVAQREVGVDTTNFAEAVAKAIRQDADVIFISQIGDVETARAAIAAAETGHLVISSMHTIDPADTITRLVGLFPPQEQALVRAQIAAHLNAIVSQRLLETTDGTSQVLATEILTNNERVKERVLDGKLTLSLDEVLKESEFFGMHTFDQTLQNLVLAKRVAVRVALPHVRNPHELRARALEAGLDI